MTRCALLDVNVLVALFDPDHIHHDTAHDWFADHRSLGWATTPFTENGFVRILANPAYGGTLGVRAIADRLRKFTRSDHHEFWPDTLSLCDETVFSVAHVRGYRQLTDIYLLGMAHARGGCLATFDRSIPVNAVRGATRRSLVVIGAVDAANGE